MSKLTEESQEVQTYKKELEGLPLGELVDRLLLLRLKPPQEDWSLTEKSLFAVKVHNVKQEISRREVSRTVSEVKVATRKGISKLGKLI